MGFHCIKATEALQEDNLLLNIKSPEASATHLIDLKRMKGRVKLGAIQ